MNLDDGFTLIERLGVRKRKRLVEYNGVSIGSTDTLWIPVISTTLHARKLEGIQIAGIVIESDYIVRFRRHDAKVVVGDMLMWAGRYTTASCAYRAVAICKMSNDFKIAGLTSYEEDSTLWDGTTLEVIYVICKSLMIYYVCIYNIYMIIYIILQGRGALAVMEFEEAIEFISRFGKLQTQCNIHSVYGIRNKQVYKQIAIGNLCKHGMSKYWCTICTAGNGICPCGKTATYCATHGGSQLCPDCITWIDCQPKDHHYDGLCKRCFIHKFPGHAKLDMSQHIRTKEMRVMQAIDENFKGFLHNVPLYTDSCKCDHRRRIDHYLIIEDTILAVETDQFAHRGYDEADEVIRYDDLYCVFAGKWVWIRFNPDPNREKGKENKTTFEYKLEQLVKEIRSKILWIHNGGNKEVFDITKMYY